MPPSFSANARVIECKHYSQFIDWSLPLIVCGDFNEDENAESPQFWSCKMGMKSSLVQFEGIRNKNEKLTKANKVEQNKKEQG